MFRKTFPRRSPEKAAAPAFALADVHFMVQKQDDGQTTRTSLKRLEMEERYEYIARMMSGMEDSKLAYEHARELITHSEEIKQKRRKNK